MAGVLDDFLDIPRDEFDGVCALCGFPLTKHQICADFAGTLVNYESHNTVPCSFCLCSECLARMIEYTNGGVDDAYRRIYISAVLTRQAEQGEYNPFIKSIEDSTE